MRSVVGGLLGAAVIGLLTLAASAGADQKIKLKDLPKAVLDALNAKFPDAKLKKAVKNTGDGETFYEIEFTYKDHHYSVECQPDGTFRVIDREIGVKELPGEVAKVLDEKYPKATVSLIEEVTRKDKVELYEVTLITAHKKEMEVQVDPQGKVLKETMKE
jgi:hypothetical protein